MLLGMAAFNGEPSSSRNPLPSMTKTFFRESFCCSSEERFHPHHADPTISRAQTVDKPQRIPSGFVPPLPISTDPGTPHMGPKYLNTQLAPCTATSTTTAPRK